MQVKDAVKKFAGAAAKGGRKKAGTLVQVCFKGQENFARSIYICWMHALPIIYFNAVEILIECWLIYKIFVNKTFLNSYCISHRYR